MMETEIDPQAAGAGSADRYGWRVRLSNLHDVPAIVGLAARTGVGMTNLPADFDEIARRVAWSMQSCVDERPPAGSLYLLVLEEPASGRIGGTCCIFGNIGGEHPFHSYRVTSHVLASPHLAHSTRQQVLTLSNELDGASEVGGLFLDPDLRGGGLGQLLARARYLFIAAHRSAFSDRTIADLRGWLTPTGDSPFWDAVGRKFFGVDFDEADRFGALHGNRFISDLMPPLPIYAALLPPEAQAVIGKPHTDGRAAAEMLRAEGFCFEGLVDIFDAGPTLVCPTDRIATVQAAIVRPIAALEAQGDGRRVLASAGRHTSFQVWPDRLSTIPEGVVLHGAASRPRDIKPGDEVRFVEC